MHTKDEEFDGFHPIGASRAERKHLEPPEGPDPERFEPPWVRVVMAHNGYVVENCDGALIVCEGDEGSSEGEVEAAQAMLYTVLEQIGPTTGRYSKARVYVDVRPGDKHPDAEAEDAAIKVWQFQDAPKDLRRLATNDRDEAWVALVPEGVEAPDWVYAQPFAGERTDAHRQENGDVVYIGCHA